MAKRIAIVGVPFSSNVGDGVIADCLSWGLRTADESLQVVKVDLAGRTAFVDTSESGVLKHVFTRVPVRLQPLLTYAHFGLLRRKKLRQHFERALEGTTAMVLGGGNLIADVQLNFPIKIAILSEALERSGGGTAQLYAVGVGGTWSDLGRRLFIGAMRRMGVSGVSVRDQRSVGLWGRYFTEPTGTVAAEVWDPGIIASDVWPQPVKQRTNKLVGIGVISQKALNLDSNSDVPHVASVDMYRDMVQRLFASGHDVLMFTNGSPEDEEALQEVRLMVAPSVDKDRLTFAPRPRDAVDLAVTVSGCDAIVAHRLHALIVAHSYALPTVALEWDPKVNAFMAKAGRADYTVNVMGSDAGPALETLERSMRNAPAQDDVDAVKAEARQQMAALARAVAE